MSDERVDALIRRLGEQPVSESAGPPRVATAIRMRAQAAREQDRTRRGRAMRNLGVVRSAAGARRVTRVRPILAVASVLLVGAATGLAAMGSRDSRRPDLAITAPSALLPSIDASAPLDPEPSAPLPSSTGWLVFSSNGSIFVTRGDGSERRQLTDGSVDDYFPVWSPNGRQVAFFSQNCVASEACPQKVAGSDLVVIDADGTNRRVLRSGLENPGIQRWVPDGSAIVATAFDLRGGPGTEQIRLDGSVGPAGEPPIVPAFVSPDGREVVRLDDGERIHISNMDGSNDRLLVPDAVGMRGSLVGWAPDGRSIAYRVSAGFLPATTWRVNRDGSDARPWSGLPGDGMLAGWSPNGQWMLVLVRGDGQQKTNQFVIAAPDGSNPRPLDRGLDGLNWTSNGRWLIGQSGIYPNSRGLADTIVLVDPEGRIKPVEIEAPGLLGMDWRPGG